MKPKLVNRTELEEWLRRQGVAVDRWGHGGSKSVETLWAELNRGESELHEDPLLRLVRVVQVLVRRGERILLETVQEMEDGRHRPRRQPPSEKMHPGEEAPDAAMRCLQEELGLSPQNCTILAETVRHWPKEADSNSYPGLPTRYLFYSVEARVDGLPEHPFSTREAAAGPGEPVQRHFWEWVPASSLSD